MWLSMSYAKDFMKSMNVNLDNQDYFGFKIQLVSEPPKGYKYVLTTDEYGFPLDFWSDGTDIVACIDFPDDWFEEEEENGMEYKVITQSYGEQPIAGYLSDIIKMVADMDVDGWHLIQFIKAIGETCHDIEMSPNYASELIEFFFIVDDNVDDCKGTLTFNISKTYEHLRKHMYGMPEEVADTKDDFSWSDNAIEYRIYVDAGETWGLEKIEKEEASDWTIIFWGQENGRCELRQFYGKEDEVKSEMRKRIAIADIHTECLETDGTIKIGKNSHQLYFYGYDIHGNDIHTFAIKGGN